MNAIEAIKKAYDYEDCKEIVSHGCESGLGFQHIYYGDTIKFFDTYEDEVLDYITDNYGPEFVVDLFRDADANLTLYKNAVVWAFIEAVACDVTCEDEYKRAYELSKHLQGVN